MMIIIIIIKIVGVIIIIIIIIIIYKTKKTKHPKVPKGGKDTEVARLAPRRCAEASFPPDGRSGPQRPPRRQAGSCLTFSNVFFPRRLCRFFWFVLLFLQVIFSDFLSFVLCLLARLLFTMVGKKMVSSSGLCFWNGFVRLLW